MTQTAHTPRKSWHTWNRKQITPELIEELAGYYRQGATLKIAAGKIGVPPGRLRMWLVEGEREVDAIYEAENGHPGHFGLLYDACVQAVAGYLLDRVDEITDAEAEWRAAGWLLERRDEEFNPAQKVELTGAEGGPIQLEGKAVVGLADVIALVQKLGYADRYGLDAGDSGRGLPVASALLPDSAADLSAADGALAVPWT